MHNAAEKRCKKKGPHRGAGPIRRRESSGSPIAERGRLSSLTCIDPLARGRGRGRGVHVFDPWGGENVRISRQDSAQTTEVECVGKAEPGVEAISQPGTDHGQTLERLLRRWGLGFGNVHGVSLVSSCSCQWRVQSYSPFMNQLLRQLWPRSENARPVREKSDFFLIKTIIYGFYVGPAMIDNARHDRKKLAGRVEHHVTGGQPWRKFDAIRTVLVRTGWCKGARIVENSETKGKAQPVVHTVVCTRV